MIPYQFKSEDAIRFAHEMHLRVRPPKGDELEFYECPYCHKREGNFSINLKTGKFKCQRASCGAQGNMITLHRDFGFDLGTDVSEYEKPKFAWKRFPKPEKPFESTDPAVAYLTGRGIPEEVIRRYEVTTKKDDDNVLVFPFLNETGELEFIKYRKIDFDKSKDKNKEWCERNTRPILFGMKQCESFDRLILTEGQIDSLSVAAAGIKNACSVPNGKNGMTWIPHCWNWLRNFEEIVVFGDYERGEMTLLEDVRSRFDCKVRAVQPEDYRGCKDANEILQKFGPDAIRKAVENAKPTMLPQVLDLADVEYEDGTREERLSTGLAMLDNALDGGLAFGFLDILTGKRGDGKSTLGSMIVKSALENNVGVFIYSGEMRKGDVRKWLDLQIAGPQIVEKEMVAGKGGQQYPRYKISSFNSDVIRNWYRSRAYIYDSGSLIEDTKSLPEIVETYIKQFGCRFVLIDNLMTAIEISGATGNKGEKQEQTAKMLARIAQRYDALILLIAHKKKTDPKYQADENDDVLGSSEITNLAGVVMSYERPRDKDRQDERLLKITKNRLTGRVDFSGINCRYDESSKRIGAEWDNLNALTGPFEARSTEELIKKFEVIHDDDLTIPF